MARTARSVATDPSVGKLAKEVLAKIGVDINANLDGISGRSTEANDKRLAVSIKLANAKKTAEEAGLSFRQWSIDNINLSYETIRKMVAVGQAPNPATALLEVRDNNNQANRDLRERRTIERDTAAVEAGKPDLLAECRAENAKLWQFIHHSGLDVGPLSDLLHIPAYLRRG